MSKLVLWPFLNWINPIFGNGASIWGWSMMRGGISLISRYTVALMNWCWWFYLLDKNTGDGDISSLILVPLGLSLTVFITPAVSSWTLVIVDGARNAKNLISGSDEGEIDLGPGGRNGSRWGEMREIKKAQRANVWTC